MTSIYLKINCGYQRVAIRTLSDSGSSKSHAQINTQYRTKHFQELFGNSTTGGSLQSNYFDNEKGRQSLFDRHCSQILSAFGKIKSAEMRQSYLETFSIENWKKLSQSSKQKHRLSSCLECALKHFELQHVFPGPVFKPAQSFSSEVETLSSNMSAAQFTHHVLSELQPVYESAYGTSFTKAVSECKHSGLQQKPTKVEKKKYKRHIQQECRDHIQGQMQATDALNVLAEGQSLKSYKRLRLAQAFATPEAKRTRKENKPTPKRKHSPQFENVLWDKKCVLASLQTWPAEKIINWSEFAREHGIPGRNRGQVAKEFAKENGIDVFELDKRPENTRIRARKLRMPGGDISVPTHSTVEQIKENCSQMIVDGTLTLGEPCHPHLMVRYTTSGGVLARKEVMAYGRKIPLITIRKKWLEKHEKLMHLHTDEEIERMDKDELLRFFHNHGIQLPDTLTEENLRETLSQKERTRTLGMWHDHSTILGHGYVLVTVRVLYDRAVFKTESELQGLETFHNLQSFIEEPQIHLLAMSSSCAEDQASLIQDRLNCIRELSTCVCTSKDISVTDRLVFFYGDKPAAQFERGTQQGGHFPCGTCGCDARRFDDLAHCLSYKWRSVEGLQQLAIAGIHTHTCHVQVHVTSVNHTMCMYM